MPCVSANTLSGPVACADRAATPKQREPETKLSTRLHTGRAENRGLSGKDIPLFRSPPKRTPCPVGYEDMRKKKHKGKHQSAVIIDLQRQRKKARSLGYENVGDYEKGLSVVSRLLAKKNKGSGAACGKPCGKVTPCEDN